MSVSDILGIIGVGLIVTAYAGATAGRLDPKAVPALLLNLTGALLVLLSLYFDFNLSAVLMEAVWVGVAIFGLIRLALLRLARRAPVDD